MTVFEDVYVLGASYSILLSIFSCFFVSRDYSTVVTSHFVIDLVDKVNATTPRSVQNIMPTYTP